MTSLWKPYIESVVFCFLSIRVRFGAEAVTSGVDHLVSAPFFRLRLRRQNFNRAPRQYPQLCRLLYHAYLTVSRLKWRTPPAWPLWSELWTQYFILGILRIGLWSLGNYLRQCNFFKNPTWANVVEIAKWQVLLLCEKFLDSHYNAFSKSDGAELVTLD